MKFATRAVLVSVILIGIVLLCTATTIASVDFMQWKKITGSATNYSGVADGILPDIMPNGAVTDGRQNSYAWSLEVFNGYLYVGTSRDIVGLVFLFQATPPNPWPSVVPLPTDLRGRIFRMKLSTGIWERVYVADPDPIVPGRPITGPDIGYRMMKTYKNVLYVGGAGFGGVSRMLAIDSKGNAPVPVFIAQDSESIRAMAEYNGQFYWASDYQDYPAIWYSSDPLKDYKAGRTFTKIDVPPGWFPQGAEIMDMVPYNNSLYVFFFDHDYDHAGFWCAKLQKVSGRWNWRVIVGDKDKVDPRYPPKYPKGMGRAENGGATPFLFKNKMYVGAISTTMWRFLHTGEVDFNNIPPTGTQIFRFDNKDNWERVMPPAIVTNPDAVAALNGFVNPLNLYLWRFAEQNGKLYAGTFDARIALEIFGLDLSDLHLWNPSGFDLYTTTDGVTWIPEALGGFNDPYNYGARTLFTNPKTGDLYLGTANPFYGCQVWVKSAKQPRYGR